MTISPFITPRLGKGRTDEKTDVRTNASMCVFVSDDISTHERLKTEDVPLHARLHPGRVRGRLTTRALDEPASSAFVCFSLLPADAPARGPSRVRAAVSLDGDRARALGIARTPSVVVERARSSRGGWIGSDRVGPIGCSTFGPRRVSARAAVTTTTTTTTSANERTTSAFGATPRGVDRSPVQTSPSPSPHPPVGARSFSHTTHGSYL